MAKKNIDILVQGSAIPSPDGKSAIVVEPHKIAENDIVLAWAGDEALPLKDAKEYGFTIHKGAEANG